MPQIEVFILQGAMPSSVALTLDVLSTAGRLAGSEGRSPPFSVHLSGSGAMPWVELSGAAHSGPDSVADLIIMPGLGLSRPDEISERLEMADAIAARTKLSCAVASGVEVATSCSGAFLLARAGVLGDRRVTTSWWLAPLFRQLHPAVNLAMDELIVRDGPLTTAGASLAQMDLMLSLVARLVGSAAAEQCSRYMLFDERRSQSRYMALSYLAAADEHIARADAWARARLSEELSINEMASAAGLAPRTFARRLQRVTGLSPIRFLQRLRVEAATHLIETTRLPVEEVARRVGYADPSALRRIMQRDAGIRPGSLRRPVIS